MREKQCDQMPILIPSIEHPRAEELQRISDILDENPIISEMVWQDLTAEDREMEKGRQSRVDCTVVSSNIHEPSDSTLLWDSVRVLTRLLTQIRECSELLKINFADHTKVAKRRMLAIMHCNDATLRSRFFVTV